MINIINMICNDMHQNHKSPIAEATGGCQDLGPHGAQELRGARGAPNGGRAAVPEPGGVPWTRLTR